MWVVYQPAAWQPGVVIQGVKSRRSLAVYRETVVVSRVREPGFMRRESLAGFMSRRSLAGYREPVILSWGPEPGFVSWVF